jgi:3-oxoacyl-[acyl-carrier protein] reductase
VNAVAPGYVETDLIATFVAAGRLDLSPVVARTPAGRLATPAEIAKAIRFLASDDASFMNGHVLAVDGGFLADYGVPFSPPKAEGN